MIRIFKTAIFLKQQEQVKPYCDEAMVASRRLKYTKGIAECYIFIANFHRSSGDAAIAHSYYDSVIEITSNTKDSSILERRAQA